MDRTDRCEKAITLIEVVISITVLMLIFGSMMTIYTQGQRYMRKSILQTTALFLAQEILENATYTSSFLRADVPGYQVFEWQLTNTTSGIANLAFKNATVFWKDERDQDQSVSLTTYRTDY